MLLATVCLLIISGAVAALAAILLRSSRQAARRRLEEGEQVRSEMDQLRSEVRALRTVVAALEEVQAERQAALVPQGSINLTKRGQILRMSRRGETPQHISAALSVPEKEVNLTLKVHRMMLGGAA
jgi:hypothetical protein